MLATVDWSNLTVAGAFVLGAGLATLATIRVVRAVTVLFEDGPHRRRPPWRRHRDDQPPDT
jgi:hypothetical protein